MEEEDAKCALSRLLIAFDELRARLAPSKYPNLEISDEGYLWFNVDTSIGTVEVIALPFGFKVIKHPSILVSLPCKAEDVNLDFLKKLHHSLVYTQNFDEILEMKRHDVFFSYLGICFSVISKTVSEVEQAIREILLKLEGKVGVLSN